MKRKINHEITCLRNEFACVSFEHHTFQRHVLNPTSEMSLADSGAELDCRWDWVVPHRDVADLEIGLGLHR